MTRIRLAAAALNQTPLAWEENCGHIRAALAAARDAGVGILCLPELCITGYGCEDMFLSPAVEQRAAAMLGELLPDTAELVVCLGLPIRHAGAIYNAAAVACNGRLLGIVGKQHLAGDGIHYEPRWFARWPAGQVASVEVCGQVVPLGDVLLDCGGVRIGLEICRDAWVADRTGARLAQRGANVLLNPSASHFAFAKQKIRERLVLEGAQRFGVCYAYANLLGNESGRSIYDGGTLLAAEGKMLLRGPRFSFADWLIATAVVEIPAAPGAEDQPPPSGDRLADIVSAEFQFPNVAEAVGSVTVESGLGAGRWATRVPGHPAWEAGPHQKAEEFSRAVALALFDYLRKSRTRGFVVSLSGGADSSAVAVLVHLLVQLGIRELGWEQLIGKLSLLDSQRFAQGSEHLAVRQQQRAAALVGQLLTCVYQATRNSSETTRAAAQAVADAIGAEFLEWNIDALVDGYVETVSRATGRSLSWQADDLALQNIQARARGPGAWLLANLRGALLLTTSNRSEAAVGYATMDGDTCGGLAPIAGIDKAFLRDWLRWIETTGPADVGPLPALAVVNRLPPTAELRPPAAHQTDEADLMPYGVLDAIERAAIRDKRMPVDVLQAVRPQFPQHSIAELGAWVERFFRLWCRNQWKRERYAPSFHLDDENLDPKTWCRFPILNSGFERELEELHAHLKQASNT